ncbi:MAG: LuxR C-terminal-related transcriptional regulator, partial [Bacteroidota bacterium]
FGYSARFLAVRPTSGGEVEVYVSHEYRGVFGLRLSSSLTERTAYREYESPPKSPNAGVATFRDRIYFYSREGMFVLENFDTGFVLAGSLNEALIPREYTSGKMTATANRLWFFTGESISFFHRGALSGKLQRQTVPVTAELVNAKSGYENITPIGGDSLLIGTADGYLVLALSAVPLHQHELFLSSATSRERDGPARPLPLTEGGDIPFLANNLHFSLAVPAYGKYFNPLFQYRIRGLQEAWSEWSTASEIEAPNLPYGSYVLEARSLLGRRTSENAIAFPFRILRPWYNSYLAYGLYVLGGALLIYLLHRSYTGYYRRKQTLLRAENERLIAARERETELELTRINNQRLEEEIANKNREMAISTMSLVKKNELLQQIKDNLLADQEPKKNIREVVRTIDQNINEEETWNLFRDAFESADREFFRKIKGRHPELTPNDLKLCAYLRLNLSSKEIAPMLNISVRSVEVKRYRLRKKMELARETGLVDYILNL